MNKRAKIIGAGLLSVAALGFLGACGNKSGGTANDSDLSKTFNYIYTTEPQSLDYVYSNLQATSQLTANFVDGLLSYDQYSQIKPALASSWKVSTDGKTYTYQIRKGVKWVDSNGNDYAEVKPSDWVTGLKHAVDSKSQALYLVAGSVSGLQDYIDGKSKDFSSVGIKADDAKGTLTYTLNNPETYWNSKTTYQILSPINADFLKEKGSKFGTVGVDGILYNGPFIPTKFDAKSEIAYKANPNYWDKKNVHVSNINLAYYDGSKPEELYNGFKSNKYDLAGIYPSESYYKNVDTKNIIWSQMMSNTRYATFNFDRQTYTSSTKDDKQKENAKKAILNKDFRQAIAYGFDKEKYVDQKTGAESGAKPVRNALVPDDFVQINGKNYGTAVQSALEAENPTWKSLKVEQGAAGTYNVDAATKAFNKAKVSLQAEGIEISKDKPIILDTPVDSSGKILIAQATSFKNSIEKNLGGEVQINIIKMNSDTFSNTVHYAPTAKDNDFDVKLFSGWGPDYQDPATYLNIFSPINGDMINGIGFESKATLKGEDHGVAAKKAINLDDYQALLDTANNEYTDLNKRYSSFAKADAWLIDNVLAIPIYQDGATPKLTKVVPFSTIYANGVGVNEYSYKYMKVQKDAVKATDYTKELKAWQKKVAEKSAASDK